MKAIIDRFEGEYVICQCEDISIIKIEKKSIPQESKEGDILEISEDKILIKKSETKKLNEEIKKLSKDLWD